MKFVGEPESGKSFWMVSPSGDWSKDNETGRAYALQFARAMAETKNFFMLQRIVSDMPSEHTGIEVGFLSAIASMVADFATAFVSIKH